MDNLDFKTVLDAGGMGILVLVLWMASKKIDRIHDTLDRLLAQLIEIIGRDTTERHIENQRRYEKVKSDDNRLSGD